MRRVRGVCCRVVPSQMRTMIWTRPTAVLAILALGGAVGSQEKADDVVMVASSDGRLLQETVTALGMIGPSAKEAIPTLEALTEHEDRQIVERATAALRQARGR